MKQTHIMFLAAITTSICMESSCLSETDARCQNCLQQQQQNAQREKEVVVSNLLAGIATLVNLLSGPKDPRAGLQAGYQAAQIVGNVVLGKPAQAVAIEARRCVESGFMAPAELLNYVESECAKAQVDTDVTSALVRTIKAEFCKSTVLSVARSGWDTAKPSDDLLSA